MYRLCRMNDFFGPTLLHGTHESTSIYRHDKKSSYNNAKDLTSPERGRKLNVKAASFLFNSPHCVWIWRGSWAGEEPYAQDTQGEGGKEAVQHNPYNIFLYRLFQCLFLFSFWQNKIFQHVSHWHHLAFSRAPSPTQNSAQWSLWATRIILEGLKIPKPIPWEMLPHSHAWPEG